MPCYNTAMNIVVVEDDPASRDLLVGRLALLGHKVYCAGSTREALQLAKVVQPDAFIVDLGLGGGPEQGLSLLAHLKDDPATARVKCLIHSVHTSLAEQAQAEGLAIGYLPKPYEREHLSKLLDTVLA